MSSASQTRLLSGPEALICAAKIVMLADDDWQIFKPTCYNEYLRQAPINRYELVLTKGAFEQGLKMCISTFATQAGSALYGRIECIAP
jgi:hypothetical protein